MILRVLDRARACPGLHRIIVATDSEEIKDLVEKSGGEVCMTAPDHRTGSDRVVEVAQNLEEDLILNLQGDEPLLPSSTVQTLLGFAGSSSCESWRVDTPYSRSKFRRIRSAWIPPRIVIWWNR
jgi:CMP-2-keto-3-deoxyoctulosonic acid synthetase